MSFKQEVKKQLKYIGPIYNEAAVEYKLDGWTYPNSKLKKILDIITPFLLKLKNNEEQDLALVFAYLSIPERHFRSGYNKEKILHYLKKYNLSNEQKMTLLDIYSSVKSSLSGREINKWNILIKKLQDQKDS